MIAETPLEDIVKRNYIEQQLFQVAPLPLTDENFPYGFDLQISSYAIDHERKTKWLRITPEQFRKIEEILRGA